MTKIRTVLFGLLIVLLAGPVWAEAPAPPAAPAAPAHAPIGQQIQSLIGGMNKPQPPASTANNTNGANAPLAAPNTNNHPQPNAAPANPAAANPAPPGAAPGAAPGNNAVNENEENAEPLEETFGTRALNLVLSFGDLLSSEGETYVENFAALPQLSAWFGRQTTNPYLGGRWSTIGNDLLAIVGSAFLAGWILEILLLPARQNLRRRKPVNIGHKLGAVVGLFGLELLPLILFITLALILLDGHETQKVPRFAVLTVIYAFAVYRIIMSLLRVFLMPRAQGIRLLSMTTPQAHYLYRWLAVFSFVIVYGYFCIDIAQLVHVPAAAIKALTSLLGLILVLMTITVIIQKRAFVSVLLRGHLSAAQRDLTLMQSLRLWFARSWHIVAIAYLVIGYVIAALGVEDGLAIMLRGTILSIFVLVMMRLLFHGADRFGMRRGTETVPPHHPVLRLLFKFVIWLCGVTAIAAAWGADIPAFFATPLGRHVTGSLFSIGVTVVVLTLIYEAINAAIERHLNQQDAEGRPIEASTRVRTLLPMLRNMAFVVFSTVIGLVVLSEIGVDIGPLLASAGVVGVAVGFGSQTLVKDFLTGLFIVMENTVAIGDVVKIGNDAGVIEAIGMRTLRLRDAEGAVHVIPFSSVTTIVNMTKEFGYALVEIGVSYDSDLRKVMDVIKSVADELQKDPQFCVSIVDPVEILGVDSFGDSAINIQARLRTRAGRQWGVKREFLLRLKERFDQEKIEIPFPTVTQVQKPVTP